MKLRTDSRMNGLLAGLLFINATRLKDGLRHFVG